MIYPGYKGYTCIPTFINAAVTSVHLAMDGDLL